MRTGVPFNEYRVFPVGIGLQGVPCKPYRVWVCSVAVILMDLYHTEILLRLILLSNVKFEFVLIFADNLRVFFLFLIGLVR